MAYATYNDLIVRYDERTIKDLLSDNGTPAVSLATSERLRVLFREATGRINAAIRVGNRYDEGQMAAFLEEAAGSEGEWTEGDEGPAAYAIEYLRSITCQIVMATLMLRRPEKYQASQQMIQQIEEEVLEPLRRGVRLFDMDGRAAAGANVKGDEITKQDVHASRTITTRTRNFYPARENQLPFNR